MEFAASLDSQEMNLLLRVDLEVTSPNITKSQSTVNPSQPKSSLMKKEAPPEISASSKFKQQRKNLKRKGKKRPVDLRERKYHDVELERLGTAFEI